jgi:hypothetical protein
MNIKYAKTTASLPAYKLTNEIPRIYSMMHAKHSGRLTAMHSGRRNGSKILLSEPNPN